MRVRPTEAVAAARRDLPPGGVIDEDYTFEGAGADRALRKIKRSDLFAPGKESLIIYNFMFPRDPADDRPPSTTPSTRRLTLLKQPCPSCVGLLDQLDGAARHVGQITNFAVVETSRMMHDRVIRERTDLPSKCLGHRSPSSGIRTIRAHADSCAEARL